MPSIKYALKLPQIFQSVQLMSVGGTGFSDNGFDYKIEEVSLIIGKVIYF